MRTLKLIRVQQPLSHDKFYPNEISVDSVNYDKAQAALEEQISGLVDPKLEHIVAAEIGSYGEGLNKKDCILIVALYSCEVPEPNKEGLTYG